MKLARKFAFVLFIGMCSVLAVEAYITFHREISLIEVDMKRDHHVMGHTLALAVARIWRLANEEVAVDSVKEANEAGSHVSIRWTWLDAPPGSPYRPRLPPDKLSPIERGVDVVSIDQKKGETGYLCTYIPVPVDSGRPGALELVESLKDEEDYARAAIYKIFVDTGAEAAVYGVLAMLLGVWFVGRPTQKLIDRARRVGGGDLATRLQLRQRDEFSELAQELNLMCDRLVEANEKVMTETAARIKTIEQLRHADRLATVGKLASGIAHELGTPLNVVWARAKMIAGSPASGSEASGNARIIAEQSEHMTRIIRQLLDFARPRSPAKAKVDLWQVARQVLGLLRPMAEKRDVTLALSGDESPCLAEVDSDQLQQVLTNLVVNGIQAMLKGGRLTVGIRCDRFKPPLDHGGPEAEYLCLYVQDQGIGIGEENLRHLFEPFFTTKRVGEGTGLGLSVSRGIVREHGGWIGVDSQLGKGSCFSIYLPLR
jgi:signal transduction histidine kinase